jgi:hypothetical protein
MVSTFPLHQLCTHIDASRHLFMENKMSIHSWVNGCSVCQYEGTLSYNACKFSSPLPDGNWVAQLSMYGHPAYIDSWYTVGEQENIKCRSILLLGTVWYSSSTIGVVTYVLGMYAWLVWVRVRVRRSPVCLTTQLHVLYMQGSFGEQVLSVVYCLHCEKMRLITACCSTSIGVVHIISYLLNNGHPAIEWSLPCSIHP